MSPLTHCCNLELSCLSPVCSAHIKVHTYLFTSKPIFRPIQIESICRQHINSSSNGKICPCLRVTTWWEKETSQLPAFAPFFHHVFQHLPNDKLLHQSKLKEFEDDKINMIQKLKFILCRVENIVVKGDNAGYQLFSFSDTVFKKLLI